MARPNGPLSNAIRATGVAMRYVESTPAADTALPEVAQQESAKRGNG